MKQRKDPGNVGSLSDFIVDVMKTRKKVVEAKERDGFREKPKLKQSNSFLKRFDECLPDVPAENILNFDEIHLTDEPVVAAEGQSDWDQNCVFRRGCQDTKDSLDMYKLNIGMILSGTACGTMLPPFVLYRCQSNPGRIKESWQTDFPPPHAYYSSSATGWFEKKEFEDWFKIVVTPWAKATEGKKVIIGDAVPSKHTSHILTMSEKLGVTFISVPIFSSHMTQPLDVALCNTIKTEWKKLLGEWLGYGEDSKKFKREQFPKRLKSLLEKFSTDELKEGFKDCGVYPYDSEKIKEMIPISITTESEINDEESRYEFDDDHVDTISIESQGSYQTREPGHQSDNTEFNVNMKGKND